MIVLMLGVGIGRGLGKNLLEGFFIMEKGEIYYLNKDADGVTRVKHLEVDYKIPQIDRIEKKLDSIIEMLDKKESEHLYVRPITGEVRITSTE